MELTELKKRAKLIEPIIRIGKNGTTSNMIEEIKTQLKKHKLIKVRILKAALESKSKEEIADTIQKETNATVVSTVGNIITLYGTSQSKKN